MLTHFLRFAAVAAVMVLMVGALAEAQESASAAQQLAAALDAAELDSIAAKDPQGDDRYVAALFFQGRLLVVSARYEAPVYLDEKIVLGNYRDVYIDLNSASIAETKILITDGGADGLRDGDAADSVNTGGGPVLAFSEADTSYAHMLQVLLTEVN